MRFLLIIGAIVALLSGCRSLSLDISHADTDKGYLNSGLRDLGKFYVFDTAKGNLTELATIDLRSRDKGAVFEKQVARGVTGVKVGGQADVKVKAKVAAEVARSSYIELDNAFGESYKNTFSDLSQEINRRESEGEDLGFSWFLDEAVEAGSTTRYLLVFSTIRADVARVGYANSYAADGVIDVPLSKGGSIAVSLTGLSEEQFKGKAVPVLVNYHVIQAFKKDGNYKFRIDRSFDDTDVTRLLQDDEGQGVPPSDE
ncbi:MAG: hypothetical protein AB8B60_19375 [Sulfitobacter sp.]